MPQGERWFLMKVTPLSEGRGAVVLHVDITERRQQEAQVNHLASFDQLTGAAKPLPLLCAGPEGTQGS